MPDGLAKVVSPLTIGDFIEQARREPIGVNLLDYSDDYVAGFLAGQASVLEEIDREPERYGVALIPTSSDAAGPDDAPHRQ